MKLDSLTRLFEDELLDILDAETQLAKALPRMAQASHHTELRQAFQDHLEETKVHADRIQSLLNRLEKKPRSKTCKAMKGLIEETNERVRATGEAAVVDAGLIASAQRIEHYEIAAYGCARTYAALLGDDEAANLLGQSLDEEKAEDAALNQLAEDVVNVEAVAAAGGKQGK